MNFLAHIYLSGDDRKLQVGNFIGDFVKGNKYLDYPQRIRDGILFHREIDNFTDTHPIFIETVLLLRPTFKRYSGIIADMYFDYFLASEFDMFSRNKSLNRFSYEFYINVLWHYKWLPDRLKRFIFHFISSNRLKKYADYDGLHSSLSIMNSRKSQAINPNLSISFLKENEDNLKSLFMEFFSEAIEFAKNNPLATPNF
ncbi:ACP phosphodiesterase [Paludibacter sp.]